MTFYLVCIISVPLYNVCCEQSLTLYKFDRRGKGVFVTGIDSPEKP